MKLLIDKKEVITCAYAKGTICRRAYWLIHDPQFVLVQYLDEQVAQSQERDKRKGNAQLTEESATASQETDQFLLFDNCGQQLQPEILVDSIAEDIQMQKQSSLFGSSFERSDQE